MHRHDQDDSNDANQANKMHTSRIQQQQPLTPQRRRRRNQTESRRLTNFAESVRLASSIPPSQTLRMSSHSAASVKVVAKVVARDSASGGGVVADSRKRQVTVFDPQPLQRGRKVPKLFAFDSVLHEESGQYELCAAVLPDMVRAVVDGTDGCVFNFGHSGLGKTNTMIGSDLNGNSLGLIACAIAWLYQRIHEQREVTGARFSVRVSAVEVYGRDESLKDLLADSAQQSNVASNVELHDDPISGAQLQNQLELRAPSPEKAARLLDIALNARSQPTDAMSHLLFTLHVYQYRVQQSGGGSGVAGGRSRLHLLDLGSGRTSRDSGYPALSLAAQGSVLLSLFNGQRHIPHRESKLSHLLREALGSLACRAAMICHVSSSQQLAADSLQILQLASKIQRIRRRKARLTSNSSDSSSCDSFGVRRAGRLRPYSGGARDPCVRVSAVGAPSESEYSSSSEHSFATAIFVGSKQHEVYLSDDEQLSSSILQKLTIGSSSDESDTGTETGSIGRRRAQRNPTRISYVRLSKMNFVEALSTQKEQWIDGPKAQRQISKQTQDTEVSTPSATAPATNSAATERWIDGPNASPPAREERRSSLEAPSTPLSVATKSREPEIAESLTPVKKDAETQSEEPYESESSASTHSTQGNSNNAVLSDISEQTDEVSVIDASQRKQKIGDEVKNEVLERVEIPHFGSSTGERQRRGQITQPLPSSLPRPSQSQHQQQKNSDPLIARVKPFVRDWVEKHYVNPSPESSSKESTPLPACRSELNSPVHAAVQRAERPVSSQMQSPVAKHRSRSAKLRKQEAPSIARVAQWLQAVEPGDQKLQRISSVGDPQADTEVPTVVSTESSPAKAQFSETSTKVQGSDEEPVAGTTPRSYRDRSTSANRQEKGKERKPSKIAAFLSSPLFGKKIKTRADKPPLASSKSMLRQKQLQTAHILSPYHTITQPRVSLHSSSGNGSDCSYQVVCAERRRHGERRCVTGGASSGYESMLRDSELSSSHDTASDKSAPTTRVDACAIAAAAAVKESRKRASAIARKREDRIRSQSEPHDGRGKDGDEDALEIDEGEENIGENTEMLENYRLEQCQKQQIEWQIRNEKISELLYQQEQLKDELMLAKRLLMTDKSNWTFDLHVATNMDPDAPGFVEALSQETEILRKRVEACKSHLALVTCFDINPPDLKK